MIPRTEGIEGWLWTSTGGTALTNLGEDDEAPNVALVFAKPLDDARLHAAFDPEFVTALAARSPLGEPDRPRRCSSAWPTRSPPRTASAAGASRPC